MPSIPSARPGHSSGAIGSKVRIVSDNVHRYSPMPGQRLLSENRITSSFTLSAPDPLLPDRVMRYATGWMRSRRFVVSSRFAQVPQSSDGAASAGRLGTGVGIGVSAGVGVGDGVAEGSGLGPLLTAGGSIEGTAVGPVGAAHPTRIRHKVARAAVRDQDRRCTTR